MMKLYIRYLLTTSKRHLTAGLPVAILATVILLSMFPSHLSADDRMKGPFVLPVKIRQTEAPVSLPIWFGNSAIQLYSKVISPADGPRSPSYPTSTAYGKEAIRSHGFFVGVLLIADRLIHESDVYNGPRIMHYGVSRYYDPVKYNTYWWDHQ